MKSLGLLLLLAAGLLLAFVPSAAVAQSSGQTSFDLETHADGGAYFFTLQGQTDHNPTLNIPANTQITVTIHNTGGSSATTHNFCDEYDNKCSDYVNNDGDTAKLTFTSTSSDAGYHCQPHQSLGMHGTFHIASANGGSTSSSTTTSSTTTSGGKSSPGFELAGVALAIAGAVLLLRRK
jgi:MYXO-CTERM domain-containing protein